MTNGEQSSHAATSPTNSEAVRCDEWLGAEAALVLEVERVAMVRRMRRYISMMAPHQKDRMAGRIVLEAAKLMARLGQGEKAIDSEPSDSPSD